MHQQKLIVPLKTCQCLFLCLAHRLAYSSTGFIKCINLKCQLKYQDSLSFGLLRLSDLMLSLFTFLRQQIWQVQQDYSWRVMKNKNMLEDYLSDAWSRVILEFFFFYFKKFESNGPCIIVRNTSGREFNLRYSGIQDCTFLWLRKLLITNMVVWQFLLHMAVWKRMVSIIYEPAHRKSKIVIFFTFF